VTHSFRNIFTAIFVLCFLSSARAQTPKLSADDTVTYINTTLHKYPALEFVDSGCPGFEQTLSISADRRSLLIKQNFGHSVVGTCDDFQTLTVPVFSMSSDGTGDWSKQGQHSSFLLDCTDHVDCFSRRSSAQPFPLSANHWHLRLTAPDRVSDELTQAIRHLLDSLLADANARLDPTDPFANRRN
jgi:hypothetical protein